MIFILAPDSFKECMTAKEACIAMEKGIKKIMPGAICLHVPLADGGEGTMHTLVELKGGRIFKKTVLDPLGFETIGEYAILGDGETGIVELASASGLHLIPVEKRNPLLTTTYGTGELIKAVLSHGIKKLIIAIGGSATNDGGAGLVQALGVKFLDKDMKEIGFGGSELGRIESINISDLVTLNQELEVEVACDVTNPLTGPNGASHIYGPQKGATKAMVEQLDNNLEHYAYKIKQYLKKDVREMEGGGAAGGAGAGISAFLKARMVKGIDVMIKHTGLEEKIKGADYIFTGEGSVDEQTAFGKTLSGVIRLAKQHNKPVIAFAGNVADPDMLYQQGITAIFGIMPSVLTLKEALKAGKENLERTVCSVVKLIDYKK